MRKFLLKSQWTFNRIRIGSLVDEDPDEEGESRRVPPPEDDGEAGVHGDLGRVVRARHPMEPVAERNGVDRAPSAAALGPAFGCCTLVKKQI